jgi:hypothetical protein
MTPDEYLAKRTARHQRLLAAAARAQRDSTAQLTEAARMAGCIPFGQPVQANHHSTQRDLNFRARIDSKSRRGYELHLKAKELQSRADACAESTAISSDDPEASDKLRARIAMLEDKQAKMVKVNKLVRKNDRAGLAEMGISETVINKLFDPEYGRPGIPAFELTNNSANILRLKKRLAQLEKSAQIPPAPDQVIGDVRIVDDANLNRVRIFFPGKPAQEIIDRLTGAGFHFSRTDGDWRRMRSPLALQLALAIVEYYKEK